MTEPTGEKTSIITIAGQPGSGKSTTAKATASELGFNHFSSGDLFREISGRHGLTVLETNKKAEQDSSIDEEVDLRLKEIGATEHNLVIDSRMAWHWMPQSFKVYLDLDMVTAAARRINDGPDQSHGGTENMSTDVSAYAEELAARQGSEALRYEKLYGVNPYDLQNYDLVVDTKQFDAQQTTALVVEAFRRWIATK